MLEAEALEEWGSRLGANIAVLHAITTVPPSRSGSLPLDVPAVLLLGL